jgi:hypothetical protein
MKFKHALLTSAALLGFLVAGAAEAATQTLPYNSNLSRFGGLSAAITDAEAGGQFTVNGDSFTLGNYGTGNYIGAVGGSKSVATDQVGATSVSMVIVTAWGTANDTIGSLTFKDSAGDSETFDLVVGVNVVGNTPKRAAALTGAGAYNDVIANAYNVVEDTFTLSAGFASSTLTSVDLTSYYGWGAPQGEPFILAMDATLAAPSGNGSGIGAGATPELSSSLMLVFGFGAALGVAFFRSGDGVSAVFG